MFREDGRKKELLDVNDLVRDVLALIEGEIERRTVMLQLELREDLPKVAGERVPLQQVLLNLMMNAIEAMSSLTDCKPLLSVKVQMHESHEMLISVTDCGTGIDPTDMKRIFEPFFTTKAEGMGMGLSICRSIVEAHGGHLWVAPGMPLGAVFHIQFAI